MRANIQPAPPAIPAAGPPASEAQGYDVVLRGGRVLDGTGSPWVFADVGIRDGRIAFVGDLAEGEASEVIDVSGLYVAPGFIETDMTRELDEGQRERLLGGIPLGRLGVPEDIAATVVFLASTQAGYITGETIHVNGGMHMT